MADAIISQKPTPLLANRNYMLLWSGQSLSLIGDYFFSGTIAIWIIEVLAKDQPWLPLATGGFPPPPTSQTTPPYLFDTF